MTCLPSYHEHKTDFFLNRCNALSQFVTFENLGHDNRHTVSQYKEFWDCAIERNWIDDLFIHRTSSYDHVPIC